MFCCIYSCLFSFLNCLFVRFVILTFCITLRDMINIVLFYLSQIPLIIIPGYIIYVEYNIHVAPGVMQSVVLVFSFFFLERSLQNFVSFIGFVDSPYCIYFLFLVIRSFFNYLLPKCMLDLLFFSNFLIWILCLLVFRVSSLLI